MPRNRVTIDTRELNRILRSVPGVKKDAVRAIGFAAEGKMKIKSRVDTGAQRSSIYTETGDASDFSRSSNEALSKNPAADVERLPIPDEDSVHVGPTVAYAIFNEFGTNSSPAQPFVVPSIRELERDLGKAAKKIVTGGK